MAVARRCALCMSDLLAGHRPALPAKERVALLDPQRLLSKCGRDERHPTPAVMHGTHPSSAFDSSGALPSVVARAGSRPVHVDAICHSYGFQPCPAGLPTSRANVAIESVHSARGLYTSTACMQAWNRDSKFAQDLRNLEEEYAAFNIRVGVMLERQEKRFEQFNAAPHHAESEEVPDEAHVGTVRLSKVETGDKPGLWLQCRSIDHTSAACLLSASCVSVARAVAVSHRAPCSEGTLRWARVPAA